jgi:hypothetical protein
MAVNRVPHTFRLAGSGSIAHHPVNPMPGYLPDVSQETTALNPKANGNHAN